MTQTDLGTLLAAVEERPLDAALRRVLSDAYEEAGEMKKATYHRATADVLEKPSNADLGVRLDAALAKANGKLRTRTLDLADTQAAVRRAVGYAVCGDDVPASYADGGGVANSYGYRARTALVLAVVRDDGKVCVDGGQAAARNYGSSPANVWHELVAWRLGKQLAERLEAWASTR